MKFRLNRNFLTSRREDHSARPHEVLSHDMKSIISHMSAKGTTLTRTDILAVLNSFFETVEAFVANGEAINTDVFKISYSIGGVFDSATDVFDKNRHAVRVNINAGKMLNDALAKIRMEKVIMPETVPHILRVKDSTSGSINNIITPGRMLEIAGSHIRVEGDNADNGVYLVANDGTKNKVVSIADNNPSKLVVLLPALATGKYSLQIITQHNGTKLGLKDPRTGNFSKLLTVA